MPGTKRTAAARRPGISIAEMVIVLSLLGIVAGFALPSVSKSIEQARIDNAAYVLGADLEHAFTLAARLDEPVRVTVDATERSYTITNRRTGAVLQSRYLGDNTEYGLTTLVSSATLEVFPNGFASSTVVYSLTTPRFGRRVRLTRAGQVRVQ